MDRTSAGGGRMEPASRRPASLRPGRLGRALGLGLVAAVIAGCSAIPGGSRGSGGSGVPADAELAIAPVARTPVSAGAASRAAAALNALGFDLYARAGSGGGNLVFSPASIGLALAMARAGASGDTAAQMDRVLHDLAAAGRTNDPGSLDQALALVSGAFPDAEGKNHDVALHVVNAPFSQRGMSVKPAYLDALGSTFGAGLRLVDYKRDAEGARATINRWVEAQTAGRIPELIPAGMLTSDSRLTLVNAVYLKAPWAVPFVAEATHDAPFRRAGGATIDVPTMRRTGSFGYAKGQGWQAVDLPYLGNRLSMSIVVPDDLAAFESKLTAGSFQAIVDSFANQEVALELPRFKTETNIGLADALSALGMPIAFDPDRADFGGITADERLYIAAVVHQANIDVDESGTEAAAATAVMMAAGVAAVEIPTVRADHPFLFAIRDSQTGAVLFLGRVADPSAG